MSTKYPGNIISLGGPESYSNYFNGSSSQYLSLASNAAFGFGTGDFTIEFWIFPTVWNASNDGFVSCEKIFIAQQICYEIYGKL